MKNVLPGLDPRRLVFLMKAAIRRCELKLDDTVILTEAATGAYAVTPVLAAMAGARKIFALAASSHHGSIEEIIKQTERLAELAGVSESIEIVTEKSEDIIAQADIITNSGHLRPINDMMIDWMKPTAIIPLMYEAWEFRASDVDLEACRRRGILVGGTNECHPAIDVFSFLGIMSVKLLLDAGVGIFSSRILLLCDNSFSSFIKDGLVRAGAEVDVHDNLSTVTDEKLYDALLIALKPHSEPIVSTTDVALIADRWPGAVLIQFWGDVDRAALRAANVPIWPADNPVQGHMGILPSAVGPEPVIRLQAGGLKTGEVLRRHRLSGATPSQIQMALEQGGIAELLTY